MVKSTARSPMLEQTCARSKMYIHYVYTEKMVVKQFKAKTFKSGNSVALRLPKGLGIEEGREMTVREEHGRYIVEPAETPRKTIDLSFLDGRSLGLKPLRPEDRVFEERELDWGGKRLKRGE